MSTEKKKEKNPQQLT